MKRLYVFSYYFPPLGRADGQLLAQFCRCFAQHGWQLSVLTTGSYGSRLFGGQRDESLGAVLPSDVSIVRVKHPIGAHLGPFLTAVRLWSSPFTAWRRSALRRTHAMYQGPGIAYAVVPPSDNAIVAYRFAVSHGVPLVIDFKDDCVDVPLGVVQRAAMLLGSTPITVSHMQAHYRTSSQSSVFYNGHPRSLHSRRVAVHDHPPPFRLCYAGSGYPANVPELFLRAARALSPASRRLVRLEFFSPENAYARLKVKPEISAPDLWRGYLPFSELASELSACDVGLVSLAAGFDFAIPSKLFTCIGLGLPILAFGPEAGALHQFVEEHAIGLFSAVGDLDGLTRNMERLAHDRGFLASCAENARATAESYTIEAQTDRLNPLFEALLTGSTAAQGTTSYIT